MVVKIAVYIVLALSLVMTGCSDKKKAQSTAGQTPAASGQTTKKDSVDVFNEFYEDSATTPTPEQSARQQKKAAKGFDDYPSASAGTTDFIPDGRYVIQVSCVRSQRFAQRLVDNFNARGWPAYIAEVANPTPDLIGTYYRVRIGGFNYLAPAKSFCENVLTGAGYEYWIDNRSNDNVGMSGYGMGQDDIGDYGSSSSLSTPATTSSSSTTATWESSTPATDSWTGTTTLPAAEPTPAAEPVIPSPEVTQPLSTPAPSLESEPASKLPSSTKSASDEWSNDSGW